MFCCVLCETLFCFVCLFCGLFYVMFVCVWDGVRFGIVGLHRCCDCAGSSCVVLLCYVVCSVVWLFVCLCLSLCYVIVFVDMV